MVKDRWIRYQCTNKDCRNDFEARNPVTTCEVCGEPVTKRPQDDCYYDYAAGQWILPTRDEDDDDISYRA